MTPAAATEAPPKPRVAVFKLSSCDGCQLQLLDAEEALLDLAGAVDIVHFREARSARRREGVSPMAVVRVIGCGNDDVGDDAAGLIAVRMLRPALTRAGEGDVDVVEAGSVLRILELAEDAATVLVVDAVRMREGASRPGRIFRFPAAGGRIPAPEASALSSHGFGLAEAIGVLAELRPGQRVLFVGVEIGVPRAGGGLSPAVEAAIPELVETLVAEIQLILAERRAQR